MLMSGPGIYEIPLFSALPQLALSVGRTGKTAGEAVTSIRTAAGTGTQCAQKVLTARRPGKVLRGLRPLHV